MNNIRHLEDSTAPDVSGDTKFVHHGRFPPPEGNRPLVTPIFQSVKYTPSSMAHLRALLTDRDKGYVYSRVSNPTVRELEHLLANLQQRDDAIATASGIAALTAVAMTFLKSGDRAVIFTESYKPTRYLLGGILSRYGVETVRISRNEYPAFEKLCQGPNPPKLVFLESPTNPALRLHDLDWLIKTAKAASCLTVLDNTFAGFLAHGEFDIDIFVHSLTKLAGGHSDAMGGVVICRKALIDKLLPVAITLGGCLDPNSAWLILRGMKTFGLRSKAGSQNAFELATWLTTQSWVTNVRYPALPNHPDFALWEKQNHGDGGSVITFDLTCPESGVDPFFDNLRLFSLAPSLGCVESLAAPCLLLFGDDLPADEAQQAGINSRTVRLAIGIENPADLKSDLIRASSALTT
jgi:cystathionine beta-lyase/cystathionine gamma-synthase